MEAAATLVEHYERVATEFLQTAVVIDDQALVARGAVQDAREHQPEPEATEHEEAPTRLPRTHDGGVHGELIVPEEDMGAAHDLDSHRLIEAFARLGIICGVLAPQEGEPHERTLEAVLPAARAGDLLIIDWVQHKDRGEATLALLEAVLAGDAQRQRVIAIYTGEPNLLDVAERTAELVDRALPDPPLKRDEGAMDMTKGAARVVVLAKPDAVPADGQPDRRVAFAELPSRMCREFAAATVGIVRGAAVAALGALRGDTHRLLARLTNELDLGYVGHRIAQPRPADAEEHLARLVFAEVVSVLGEHSIGAQGDSAAVRLWLDGRPSPPMNQNEEPGYGRSISDKQTLNREEVYRLLDNGLGDEKVRAAYEFRLATAKTLKRAARQSTEIVSTDVDEARRADELFSALMTLESSYRRPDRSLRLGTIVAQPDGARLLCVQPVCDSVRLCQENGRRFPFVPLEPRSTSQPADLVIIDGDQRDRVSIVVKPFEVILHEMPASNGGTVQPAGDPPAYRTSSGLKLRWLAQMKVDHAQRVAERLGGSFARVGVDEPEILRLSR